ncbi:helix-turn-helix domain-containing protein [Deinococcus peraridilitoris]|uniref:Putative transcription regulator containing HTH domain protein n=1 Tax=Deinococcus peraridilitoris (strain DSM 19664 / LMG 22246 / CIP 109416 / KR-200) TaxID=937777 RepID=L0A2U6_DEIPD|nr:helix-turn-helix domain-containing protein [Deinococcus peraridilitoris]AFZ67769.1 putative transcription regulator containing HTH domain protein [Deinococcus peraridilitoris DSM 19664]
MHNDTIRATLSAWEQLDRLAHDVLTPIEGEGQYEVALTFVGVVWEQVEEDARHALTSLLQLLVERIGQYEELSVPIPDAPAHHVLAFLMEQRGVTQKEIEAATGIDQSNLSKLLRGKRELNTEQIVRLSAYFHVNPVVFLPRVG